MAAPLPRSQLALGPVRRAETLTAWALVLPAFIGFLLFYALPTLRAIEISLTDWNLLRTPKFVGLANYATMLQDGKFWQGMKLSAYYVALNIPPQTVLGLFLAVAMDRLTKSLFVKSIVLLPYLLSNVLVVKAPGQAHADTDTGQRVAISLPAASIHVFDEKGHALERRIPIADLLIPHAA